MEMWKGMERIKEKNEEREEKQGLFGQPQEM